VINLVAYKLPITAEEKAKRAKFIRRQELIELRWHNSLTEQINIKIAQIIAVYETKNGNVSVETQVMQTLNHGPKDSWAYEDPETWKYFGLTIEGQLILPFNEFSREETHIMINKPTKIKSLSDRRDTARHGVIDSEYLLMIHTELKKLHTLIKRSVVLLD